MVCAAVDHGAEVGEQAQEARSTEARMVARKGPMSRENRKLGNRMKTTVLFLYSQRQHRGALRSGQVTAPHGKYGSRDASGSAGGPGRAAQQG